MKHISTIAIIVLSFFLFSCRTVFEWQPKGPKDKSGPVKQIVVDKNDSNKLYAATENGGVWVLSDYTDENAFWRPLTDKLENLQTRGFDVSQRNPNTMVMGNGLGHLHFSRDGGESWSKIDLDSFGYIRKIAIDDVLGTILVFNVASSEGLFKVEVRGNGQSPIVNSQINQKKEILDFVIDRASKRQNVRYYAARNDGVYKSVDFGATWNRVLNRASSNAMIKIAQPNNIGATVVKNGKQLFTNDSLAGRFRLLNTPPDSITSGGNSDIGYRNTFGGRTGDWNHAVAISPTNSEEIVYGSFRPYYSSNQGSTWTGVGFGHEDLHDIVYVNNDVLTATDGGIVKLTRSNNGNLVEGHQYINNGLNTYQFYRIAVNGNTAVGNADHNGIKYTENLNSENPDWEDVFHSGYGNNGLENDFVYKDIKNPNRYFVQFEALYFLRLQIPYLNTSRDLFFLDHPDTPLNPFFRIQGGSLNQEFNNLNYPLGTIAQDPRDSVNTMLIAAHDSDNRTVDYSKTFSIKIAQNSDVNPEGIAVTKIRRSNPTRFSYDDNEMDNQLFPTWSESYANGSIPIVSIAYSSDENGKAYALDESGKLITNTNVDNSSNWLITGQITRGNSEETMRQLIVDQNNTTNLYAISHEHIYTSTNEGVTWVVLPFNLEPNSKINTITQHHKNFNTYFVGTSRGVYHTTNSGRQWSLFGEELPNAEIMQLFVEGKFLYAVSFGRGLWRTDLENPKRVLICSNR